MNDRIRWTEKARLDAEPSHLDSLIEFASRAYRRPLSDDEQGDIRSYYKSCRQSGLDHESAIREGIVSILMSPDMCYRVDLAASGKATRPLTDYELASRLSYFLWSSIPDDKLLAHAKAGDLHEPAVLSAQVQRMLQDPRVRSAGDRSSAATGSISAASTKSPPSIATASRHSPTIFGRRCSRSRSGFSSTRLRRIGRCSICCTATGTFVNPVLARHYGMPSSSANLDQWVRIDDADRFGRGGILPMAAFLTKNAPGLRTSPVKRGNWVVKNVLGERIPAPPPNVPQLPRDEAKLDLPLREMLARHRQDPNCAACHARFDSLGLVFEGFGPVGERRDKDLAGHAIDSSATFPGAGEGTGLDGLRRYIRQHRQKDFVDNICRKMLAYALGRSLMLSDDPLIHQTEGKLAQNDYRLNTLVECFVTGPQFLNKRGGDAVAQR